MDKLRILVCIMVLANLVFAEEVTLDFLQNYNPLHWQKLFCTAGKNWTSSSLPDKADTSAKETTKVLAGKWQIGMGLRGGLALVLIPDWWLNIQTPITTSLNLRIGFRNAFILEGELIHIWNTQDWWFLNPYIWSISIEGNSEKTVNPRLGIDYHTGYESRYGWNLGLRFVPSPTKKFSYEILVLLRFEDIYGDPGLEISSKPRGIFASFGIHYQW